MEIQAIISSGLLELYVGGIASEKESRDVEQWMAQYPEVAAEVKEISAGLESYAKAHSVTPSVNVKEKIFAQIIAVDNGKAIPFDSKTIEPAKVIQYPFWKVVAAAAVTLLIASIALNVATYNKYSAANRDLIAAKNTLGSLEEEKKIMEEGMQVVQSKYSVPVALKGMEASPDAAAKIFWMQNTGEVFIDPSNLPEAPAGKQYQLWAFVNGKPVDGGMILTSSKGDKYRIQKMKSFGKVEAFAVTLEAEKGNQTPKGPMYVMGKM